MRDAHDKSTTEISKKVFSWNVFISSTCCRNVAGCYRCIGNVRRDKVKVIFSETNFWKSTRFWDSNSRRNDVPPWEEIHPSWSRREELHVSISLLFSTSLSPFCRSRSCASDPNNALKLREALSKICLSWRSSKAQSILLPGNVSYVAVTCLHWVYSFVTPYSRSRRFSVRHWCLKHFESVNSQLEYDKMAFRLDANLRVKIADFGLSRDVSRCGMYEAVNKDRGIPIRWMPIESLEDQQVT